MVFCSSVLHWLSFAWFVFGLFVLCRLVTVGSLQLQIIGICLQSLVLLLVFVKCVLFAWFGMLMMCFAYWHSMLLMHAHHGPGHFTQDRGLAPPANGIPQARLRSECYSGRPGLPFHKQAPLLT